MLNRVKGGLIVSCQALKNEPLHSAFIMGKMALAAERGGALGIRANSAIDINEISKNTTLPIIGLVKKDYPDTPIYITPTIAEIEELATTTCSIIAFDATNRVRHSAQKLSEFVNIARSIVPDKQLMADISTLEEAIVAESLGVDCISTTMIGYTEETSKLSIESNDFEFLKLLLKEIKIPIIAEGRIDTPEKAKMCLDLGIFAVVVGAAITRPQLITKAFIDKIYGV